MGPVFYVMAILGCGYGDGTCRTARIEQAHYATRDACTAATAAALTASGDLDFPVVTAECRVGAQQMADARPIQHR